LAPSDGGALYKAMWEQQKPSHLHFVNFSVDHSGGRTRKHIIGSRSYFHNIAKSIDFFFSQPGF